MYKTAILIGLISFVILAVLGFGWRRSFTENGDAPLLRGIMLESGWVAQTDTGAIGCLSITVESSYKGLPFVNSVNQSGCNGEYVATNTTAKILNGVAVFLLSLLSVFLSVKLLRNKKVKSS